MTLMILLFSCQSCEPLNCEILKIEEVSCPKLKCIEKFKTTTVIYSTTTQPIKKNDETLVLILLVFFVLGTIL